MSDRFIISPQAPAITLTYPNGGENLDGCTSQNITWSINNNAIEGPPSGSYDIYVSFDNMTSWSNLVMGDGGQNWSWPELPNINYPLCWIKIVDANDSTKYDISDSSFTIVKTTDVVLLTPNSGEQWIAYETEDIEYVKTSNANNVNLYYSLDNGLNWTTITTNHDGGTYNWTIPNFPSEDVLIKVQDMYTSCRSDLSDTVFTILSEVEVISPNGGEQIQAEVGIPFGTGEYYMDNVPVVTDGGYFYDSGGPTSGYGSNESYYKTFYPETPGNKIRIKSFSNDLGGNCSNFWDRLRFYHGPTPSGGYSEVTSSGSFDFTSNHSTGAVTVYFNSNHCNEGSGWEAYIESLNQPTELIDWNIIGTSKYFNLSYSVDNGLTWNKIADKYYTTIGEYNWNVPNNPSTNCLVKVEDWENGNIVDISDNVFEILEAPSYIEVQSPNAQNLYVGSDFEIQWQSEFLSSPFVNIEYSYDNGVSWSTISIQEQNDGSYMWNVPNTVSNMCYVRITDYGNQLTYDLNDLLFTISPAVQLNSPNGGANQDYRGCTISTIDWDVGGTSGSYNIYYSIDNGVTWISIYQNYSSGSNNCTYSWIVPNTPTNTALVKVEDAQDNSKYDISDANFIISPTIELLTLNYSGVLQSGSQTQILWHDTLTSNYYDIYFSDDAGVTWNNIVSNYYTVSQSYSWLVPSISSTNCVIKVEDANNLCKTASSIVPFNITNTSLNITVISQNNYINYQGCDSVQIQWVDSSLNPSYLYNIEYSDDGGQSWNSIINNYYSQGQTYYWVTPNINANNCLFAIRDANDANNYGITQSHFSINQSVSALILFSTQSLNLCVGDTLILTSNSLTGNLWSNGEVTQSIIVTSSGNYSLQVTGTNGCQATSQVYSIYFSPLPNAPVISANSPTIICDGDFVELETNNAPNSNFWWNTGSSNTTINVYSSGDYWVTFNQNGCSVESNHISVTVNNNPQTPFISSNSPINSGNSLSLYSNYYPNTSYNWTGPNGFVSNLQNPILDSVQIISSGVYSLILSENGCSSSPSYVNVIVQQTNNNLISVSGSFYDENNNLIDAVDLNVDSSTLIQTNNGFFQLSLSDNLSHTITPEKDNDSIVTNGITTFDILLIQSHILGNNPLSSPYKLIAADANKSNSISTLDLLFIQQLILQVSSSYPQNSLWRFIDSDFIFPNPSYPYNSPGYRVVSSPISVTNQDFVGVKIGDVNNSWNPNIARETPKDVLSFYYQEMENGIQEIPIYSHNFNDIKSFQFTLGFDPDEIEILDVKSDYNIYWNEEYLIEGSLPLLFYDNTDIGTNIDDKLPVFVLTANVKTKSKLNLNSKISVKEAINNKYEFLDLSINQNMNLCENSTAFPNPFKYGFNVDLTSFDVNLPLSLSIYSVDGRKVYGDIISSDFKDVISLFNEKIYQLKPGIYFVDISSRDCFKMIKVIKE